MSLRAEQDDDGVVAEVERGTTQHVVERGADASEGGRAARARGDAEPVEVDAQLERPPDLVAVPVGVGSLAEAVVRHYRRPGHAHPRVLSVEPDTAACVLASLTAGRSVRVSTAATVMAGLNCGTVSTSAWPVLRQGCDAAVAVSDDEALRAVDDLGRLGVSSGPSGAATLAGVRTALNDVARRTALDLDDDAVVVLLSTEGNSR